MKTSIKAVAQLFHAKKHTVDLEETKTKLRSLSEEVIKPELETKWEKEYKEKPEMYCIKGGEMKHNDIVGMYWALFCCLLLVSLKSWMDGQS